MNRLDYISGRPKPSYIKAGQIWHNHNIGADPVDARIDSHYNGELWRLSDGTFISESLLLKYFKLEE